MLQLRRHNLHIHHQAPRVRLLYGRDFKSTRHGHLVGKTRLQRFKNVCGLCIKRSITMKRDLLSSEFLFVVCFVGVATLGLVGRAALSQGRRGIQKFLNYWQVGGRRPLLPSKYSGEGLTAGLGTLRHIYPCLRLCPVTGSVGGLVQTHGSLFRPHTTFHIWPDMSDGLVSSSKTK